MNFKTLNDINAAGFSGFVTTKSLQDFVETGQDQSLLTVKHKNI